jgi:17beta-estradiol 17-dehydrogenase / very-long-chain 3-oxoacyl-CoA reductase
MGFNMELSYFHKYAENNAPFSDLINCNIKSVTKMTAIVLPNMVKKKKGIIINIGSGAGRLSYPILTTYSASKRYVDFFSR